MTPRGLERTWIRTGGSGANGLKNEEQLMQSALVLLFKSLKNEEHYCWSALLSLYGLKNKLLLNRSCLAFWFRARSITVGVRLFRFYRMRNGTFGARLFWLKELPNDGKICR